MGILILPTELLLFRTEKLGLDRSDRLLPPPCELESRLSSSLVEVRLRPLTPLRVILIRPMMRSETEDVPIENPPMVISSSPPPFFLKIRGMALVYDAACVIFVCTVLFSEGVVFCFLCVCVERRSSVKATDFDLYEYSIKSGLHITFRLISPVHGRSISTSFFFPSPLCLHRSITHQPLR